MKQQQGNVFGGLQREASQVEFKMFASVSEAKVYRQWTCLESVCIGGDGLASGRQKHLLPVAAGNL